MNVVGLQVAVKGSKRIVFGVVLDTSKDTVVDSFRHVASSDAGEAQRTKDARDAVSSHLRAFEVAAVVLAEADYSPQARVQAGTKERLRIEGACMTACLDHAPVVEVMNGPAIGRACNSDKAGAVALASQLGLDVALVPAGAAALAGKSLVA